MKNYDEILIIKFISESITIADVLRKLNLDPRGYNYKIVKDIINKFNINTDHFIGKAHGRNKSGISIPWEDLLIENSKSILTTDKKKRLIKAGLLINKCNICGIDTWLNDNLSLQLDHINGICNDHRIENLRLLCPNCHSQTDTFAGKNIKKTKMNIKDNCGCGNLKGIHNKLCSICNIKYQAFRHTKIVWPDLELLTNMVINIGYSQTGRNLGVSDDAIRKRLKSRGIVIPRKYPKRN